MRKRNKNSLRTSKISGISFTYNVMPLKGPVTADTLKSEGGWTQKQKKSKGKNKKNLKFWRLKLLPISKVRDSQLEKSVTRENSGKVPHHRIYFLADCKVLMSSTQDLENFRPFPRIFAHSEIFSPIFLCLFCIFFVLWLELVGCPCNVPPGKETYFGARWGLPLVLFCFFYCRNWLLFFFVVYFFFFFMNVYFLFCFWSVIVCFWCVFVS